LLLGVYAFYPSTFLVVMMIEVLGYSGLLFWAWNRSRSGDLNTPIVLLSAATLVIVVSMGVTAPILMPLAVLLAVLAVVLGLPYIGTSAMRGISFAAVAATAAMAPLYVTDGLAPIGDIPTPLVATVLGVSVPLVSALVFLLIWQYNGRLNETLVQVRTSNEELREAAHQLSMSRRRIVGVEEELRRQVAQQLHGPVQNRLLVASHRLRMAMESEDLAADESVKHIQQAADLIADVNQATLRDVIRRLHPTLIRLSLSSALDSLANEFRPSFDVDIQVVAGGSDNQPARDELPQELRLAVYRIVEEALNNVLKHAAATCVDVELTQTSDMKAELLIRDDGRGFDLDKQELGFGILTMQDYSGAVGGTLVVNSTPGSGTTIEAMFPLPADEASPSGSAG
jgi:signal transduction histidine kinase